MMKTRTTLFWARTVSAARALRGEKSPQEAEEELTARRTIIEFFTNQFARKDAKTDRSPKSGANEPNSQHSSSDQLAADQPPAGPDGAETAEMPAQESNPKQEEVPTGNRSRPGRGLGGAGFQTLAGDAGKITREAFKKHVGGSASAQDDSGKPSRRGFSRPPRSGESSDLRKTPTSGQRDMIRRLRERTENGPVPPDLERRKIRVGNAEREFFINIPDSIKGKPSPVVFALHGGASKSGLAMHLSDETMERQS